jgi:CRP-like cAMP-binding protein
MVIEKLFNYFNDYVALNTNEKNALYKIAKEKRVKRKQFILQEDDVCKNYTFVVEGLLKMYVSDKNAIERNIQFAVEN